MLVNEISKDNGDVRVIPFDEAVERLSRYYTGDIKTLLTEVKLLDTPFFYFEIE